MDGTVCHCFKHTRKDIELDFLENGRSLILEAILREKRFGNCRCAALNPEGR